MSIKIIFKPKTALLIISILTHVGLFVNVFASSRETDYKAATAQVTNPLMDKIENLTEVEHRYFFSTILDASERSLRGLLFMSPSEFDFERNLSEREIGYCLRKISMVLTAYSYYFVAIDHLPSMQRLSFRAHWQKRFESYEQIFDKKMTLSNVNYYAAGLKEDTEKGYSMDNNGDKAYEMLLKDYETIGNELLKTIWHEDIKSDEKKALFIGTRIWKAYQQIVQPYLTRLFTE